MPGGSADDFTGGPEEHGGTVVYEDMGHILNRYYKIADIPNDTMKERLAIKETKKPIKEAKSSKLKESIFGKNK